MNRHERLWRLLPMELVVGITLVGMILIGAVVYSNAVGFQRFIEPILAVLQPRLQYSDTLKTIVMGEFDEQDMSGINLHGDTLYIKRAFLQAGGGPHDTGFRNYQHLGNVFLKLLDDSRMRMNTDFIMISLDVPFSLNGGGSMGAVNRKARAAAAREAELILVTILNTSADLRLKYAPLFTSSVISAPPKASAGQWVTIRIIPSDRLHAEVLMRLEKYAR